MTDAHEPGLPANPAAALHCADLTPDRLADYLRFFDHEAFPDNPRWAGCYCYHPLHDPAVVRWHDRSGADTRRRLRAPR